MIRKLFWPCAVVWLLTGLPSRAWFTGLPLFKVHRQIAEQIVSHPAVAERLQQAHIDPNAVVAAANREPNFFDVFGRQHPYYPHLVARVYTNWPLTAESVGVLIHSAFDCGVACNHGPACEVFNTKPMDPADKAEFAFERAAEKLPALPTISDPYPEGLPGGFAVFHADILALAAEYKAWWEAVPNRSRWTAVPPEMAEAGVRHGARLALTLTMDFLDIKLNEP